MELELACVVLSLSFFSCPLRLPADNCLCIAVSINGFFLIVFARNVMKLYGVEEKLDVKSE